MKGQHMKNSNIIKVTACAATLCVASAGGVAVAQTTTNGSTTQTTTTQTTTTTQQPTQVVARSSTLIGTKVENRQGQCLGRISDIVVDISNNQVSYCVLSVKHGLFAKTRYIPVPLAAFQPGATGNTLILNASKANLAQARGYEYGQWPSSITPAWGAEPGQAVELPPVEVFGPENIVPAPIPVTTASYGDPTVGPMPLPRNASAAIDEMTDGLYLGFPVR